MDSSKDAKPCDDAGCACHSVPRRDFLQLAGAALLGVGALPLKAQESKQEFMILVPVDKHLSPEWKKSLVERGHREICKGDSLRFVGMPVGGICAGQVFLGGDGRLWLWDIFNHIKFGVVDKTVQYQGQNLNAGGGANYVQSPDQVHPFEQGFALRTVSQGTESTRSLDKTDWKDISFIGEYPMGFVEYRDQDSPVEVSLEAFSPYIPLHSENSGLPCTILRYTVKNVSDNPVEATLGGWMENAAGRFTIQGDEALRANKTFQTNGTLGLTCSLQRPPATDTPPRPTIVFEDFEKPTYEGWTVEGQAFGPGPMTRKQIPSYQGDLGGEGDRVVNSHYALHGETVEQGDAYTGKLTSRTFTIERKYIAFYIGGGAQPGKTCLNLIIDGKIAFTATGADSNRMEIAHFSVQPCIGKQAHIEIVDQATGPWGHIEVSKITFTDIPPQTLPLEDRFDYGEMSLALLEATDTDRVAHALSIGAPQASLFAEGSAEPQVTPLSRKNISGVVSKRSLQPGEQTTFTFAIAWRFPNLTLSLLGKVGNYYAVRFPTTEAVVSHVASKFDDLYAKTKLWHATWYDSTLPYWMLDRVMGNNATLATMTSVRFANGRFYGWEGIGCCDGTCGHVWAYAQGPARLFPDLERTVREMVDYGIAFHPDSGIIEFRGEYGNGYATDAQSGYVLRTYREHQMSADSAFLTRVWPRAKKALQYLIEQDGNADGIIENRQHNTLDEPLYGASSWLSSLYNAALLAGEQMALEMGDEQFASQCKTISEQGFKNMLDVVWNGEYFIQKLDLAGQLNALRYGDGCEIDQVMGQWWAWQLGLGRVLEVEHTKKALQALFRYNFSPDVGQYRDIEKPGRWYAVPGESGLIMCTFPQGDRHKILGDGPIWASAYFNECMTGFEYEAGAHMISEGLLEEGLAVTKAVHDRYHASKRNPWNEVECSDHYARCMAVHSAFIAVCGFENHGPKGHIGFAPRLTPENFRTPFTVAEGWGTYSQKISSHGMNAKIALRHGSAHLRTIALEITDGSQVASVKVTKHGRSLVASHELQGKRLTTKLEEDTKVAEGESLEISVSFA